MNEAQRRRIWHARFMQALAKLEDDKRRHTQCGGCGLPFGEHSDDYDECVQKVLAIG